jgi:hypothetical protein
MLINGGPGGGGDYDTHSTRIWENPGTQEGEANHPPTHTHTPTKVVHKTQTLDQFSEI